MHLIPENPASRRPYAAVFMGALLAAALPWLGACATDNLAGRQTETLTRLGFEPLSEGWRLTLPERISFEFNKADLEPALRSSIADAARQLLAVDIRELRVEGHSDNIGGAAYNQDLSLRRADSVAAVLVAEGFAGDHVATQGYGSTRPAADNASEDGRAQNRRVEIIVTANVLAAP